MRDEQLKKGQFQHWLGTADGVKWWAQKIHNDPLVKTTANVYNIMGIKACLANIYYVHYDKISHDGNDQFYFERSRDFYILKEFDYYDAILFTKRYRRFIPSVNKDNFRNELTIFFNEYKSMRDVEVAKKLAKEKREANRLQKKKDNLVFSIGDGKPQKEDRFCGFSL